MDEPAAVGEREKTCSKAVERSDSLEILEKGHDLYQ